MPPEKRKMMATPEVISALGCPYQSIYYYIKKGSLHPIKNGTLNYFHPDEVERLQRKLSKKQQAKKRGRPPKVAIQQPQAMARSIPERFAPEPYAAPDFAAPAYAAPAFANPPKAARSAGTGIEPITHGKMAAAATKLFNQDYSVRDIVTQLEVSYEFAQQLYGQWKDSGPELHLSPKQQASLANRFDWHESPATTEGLMRAINAYLTREIERAVTEALRNVQQEAEAAVAQALAQKSQPRNGKSLIQESPISDSEKAALEAAEREAALDD